jgi:hydrogenase maturation protease
VTTLVVGVGSPFGDDRAGWEVVAALDAALRQRPALPVAVRTCTLDRPGAALVEALQGVQHAVIVDAAHESTAAPGTFGWLDQRCIETEHPASSHGFGLGEALALTRALGALPARVDVLAICGARFEGDALSEPVRAAVPTAVQAIIDLLHARAAASAAARA